MMHQSVLSSRVHESTQYLIQNLLASEPFLHYQKAKIRLDSVPQAQALLNDLTHTQANLRQAQAQSTLRQTEMDSLRALQSQVRANSVIVDYIAAQQEAVKFLREINNEISQLLGMNFAVLAQKSTC